MQQLFMKNNLKITSSKCLKCQRFYYRFGYKEFEKYIFSILNHLFINKKIDKETYYWSKYLFSTILLLRLSLFFLLQSKPNNLSSSIFRLLLLLSVTGQRRHFFTFLRFTREGSVKTDIRVISYRDPLQLFLCT